MSTERVGEYPAVELPEDFGDSTSWQRARDEETTIEPINRADWMVRVGDGDRHRVVFGTRSGTPVGECDCKGHTHHGWCAHLAAMLLAYVREEIVVADLAGWYVFVRCDWQGTPQVMRRVEPSTVTKLVDDEDTGWSYLTFHDLRRTWATALASEDVDPLLVCDWGGWNDLETFLVHYRGTFSPEAQKRARDGVAWL